MSSADGKIGITRRQHLLVFHSSGEWTSLCRPLVSCQPPAENLSVQIWPVVHRPSYDQDTAQEKTPLLHYAIMAVSVRPDLTRLSKQSETYVEQVEMLS
jgi:hypothetical protein